MIPPIHLRVGDQIIYNEMYARYLAFTQHKPIIFECYDQENDLLDWTTEPTESFDELMIQHAQALRHKYDRLILLWSGGTDSHTIFKIFIENNIHLDEIIVLFGEHEHIQHPIEHAQWMVKSSEHMCPKTKITVKNRLDPESKSRIIVDDDWMFSVNGMLPRFGMSSTDQVMEAYCNDSYGNNTWGLINGLEQPNVVKKIDGYYSNHFSGAYRHVLGFNNAECFFTAPKLALKQAHMIRELYKKIEIMRPDFSLEKIAKYRFGSPTNYGFWTKGIGRHGELNWGSSFVSKMDNFTIDLQKIGLNDIDGTLTRQVDPVFDALISQGNPTALKWEQGLKNFLLEKDFCRHLNETSPSKDVSLFGRSSGERVYSKSYYLGK